MSAKIVRERNNVEKEKFDNLNRLKSCRKVLGRNDWPIYMSLRELYRQAFPRMPSASFIG
jgi:hypothetical protein